MGNLKKLHYKYGEIEKELKHNQEYLGNFYYISFLKIIDEIDDHGVISRDKTMEIIKIAAEVSVPCLECNIVGYHKTSCSSY